METEVDHDFGIDPGRSWLLRGRFQGCVVKLGLAFRCVPRLQCRQACGPTGIPEPGLAARFV
jgi:hypothetical protein